ncbi:MAG: hypothetical protein JNM91_02200 [Flavobacteriales bacterium]|nr:hypothetical protein [Flavobacteriales bacterium]
MEAHVPMTIPARTTKRSATACHDRDAIDWSSVRFCVLVLIGLALSTWFWANVLA